jgi:HYR domain-containing protein
MKYVDVHNGANRRYVRLRSGIRVTTLRILAPVGLVVAALLAPAGARPADSACVHTDAVFYSTDTLALAPRLRAAQSACADYYISVTPKTDGSGSPRGGVAPAVRANGPQFHAMTEVRLGPWMNWVQKPGNCVPQPESCWYQAGVEVRREMVTAGFDVSQGDTWAINEVGSPTSATEQMAKHVFTNDDHGAARRDLLEFIRGLYVGTGLPGMPPAPGLVFAANPTQITTDLHDYKQGLRDWYKDGAFWSGMEPYVRFWAQETYADARTWGVDGSTLPDRAAHLNDYFQHAERLAAVDPDASEAARAFLAATYTPVANAAFPWGPPETMPGGIGFGFTNITVPQMQNFIATQTYALRSSPAAARFGFAWVPVNNSNPALPALRDALAQSIQRSETDPAGACGAALALCDSFLNGAAFTEAWKTFTDATPPVVEPEVNGPKGENGWYVGDVTVSWNVFDPESAFTTSGCGTTVVDADTAGRTFTCVATSLGGTTTADPITIKRDATAPVLSVPDGIVVDATSADGATVEYAVSANDVLTPRPRVSCAPPSGSVFPLGTTTVSCTATDDAGNDASKTFDVHVRGAAEQIAGLEDAVTAATLRHGLRTALLAKLDAAAQALANGDDSCPHLDAFVNLVRNAERVGHLSAAAADMFASSAVQAARVTGCSPAP